MDDRVINRHGFGFLDLEGVGCSVDGRVDSEREEVLMVWCQNSRCNDGPATNFIANIDRRRGENSCSTHFIVD